MNIVGAGGNIGALVAAIMVEQPRVMIAEGAGVDLHDEPVVEAHPRHHGQHMRAKQLGVGRADLEIGRASCRERVCQSVSISVVDLTFKKKKDYNRKETISHTEVK